MIKRVQFLNDLSALLKRYGVSGFGSCSCCSGTHVKFADESGDYEFLSVDEDRAIISMSHSYTGVVTEVPY